MQESSNKMLIDALFLMEISLDDESIRYGIDADTAIAYAHKFVQEVRCIEMGGGGSELSLEDANKFMAKVAADRAIEEARHAGEK